MVTKRTALLRSMMTFDLAIMMLAFGIATWSVYQMSGIASTVSFDNFLSIRVKIGNLVLVSVFLYCWHVIFEARGFYLSHRLTSGLMVVRDIVIATLFGTFILLLIALGFKIALVNLPFICIFWLSSTFMLIATRLTMRIVLQRFRLAGRNLRHVAVVGTNGRARDFVEKIKSMPELGYRFIGFIDDDSGDATADESIQIVANYNDFAAYARDNVVDEIVVFSPLRSQYDKIAAIVETAESQGIILRFGSNPFALKIGHSVVDQVGDVAVSTVQTGSMYGHPSLGTKTVLDFLVSGSLLLLLSPLLIVVAVLIKLRSPGPVLFVQQRMGLNKRRFNIYKFRTMRQDAEQLQIDLEQMNEADGAGL